MHPTASDRPLRRFFARWERELHAAYPQPDWRILAGVSGGCDSLVLAWLLHESARRGRGTLVLGHVNHQLRSEAADDLALARRFARRLRAPLHAVRVDPRALARARGWSLEQAARVSRAQALGRVALATGCSAIALGHQMDDQAETMLLRLLRGAGPRGLGAMAECATLPLLCAESTAGMADLVVVRPLLGFRREELKLIARYAGIEWREDSSNKDPRILRNRIRLELIPELARAYNPRLVESLAELARWQRLESEPLESAAIALLGRALRQEPAGEPAGPDAPSLAPAALVLDVGAFSGAAPAVATRALWLAYQQLAGAEATLGSRHATELLRLLERGVAPADPATAATSPEIHLPGRLRARLRGARLFLERHEPRPARESRTPRGAPAGAGPARSAGGRAIALSPRATGLEGEILLADPELFRESGRDLAAPAPRARPGSWVLEVERRPGPPRDLGGSNLAVFDLEALDPPLLVRRWRPGDWLIPFGMQGRKKVSDLLGERKVPRAERAAVPVVVDRRGILWVVGHRRAQRAAVTPETREVLVLRLTRAGEESA